MKKLVLVLIVFVLLFVSGCVKRTVLPDPRVPHRVAEETKIKVWCRLPDGRFSKCDVRLLEGWWVASPQIVEVN